jgi:hypothetical protein
MKVVVKGFVSLAVVAVLVGALAQLSCLAGETVPAWPASAGPATSPSMLPVTPEVELEPTDGLTITR